MKFVTNIGAAIAFAMLAAACTQTGRGGTPAPQQGNQAPRGDAPVSGTKFDATGSIRCTIGRDAAAGNCPFGVARRGSGNADVTITKPDGRKRVVFFAGGKATGADVSQADPGQFSATKSGDNNIVFIGAERYEIPDAAVFGG